MKKRINSILLVMLALFTSQNISAAEPIYSHSFTELGEWTFDSNINDCWTVAGGFLTAYGYAGTGTTYATSPKITLDANGNEVEFNHKGWYFGDFSQEAKLVVKEVGGEWTEIEGVTYPTDYNVISSGKLAIPSQFNGKDVQIGFKYTVNNNNVVGNWYIQDITVTAAGGGSSEELKEKTIFEDPWMNKPGYYQEGNNIWSFPTGYLTANASYSSVENVVSYYVTPNIQLGKKNTIQFNHTGRFFTDMSKDVSVCVREVGSDKWTTVEGLVCGASFQEASSGVLNIPAEFDGKTIEIGFRYTAKSAADAGEWEIKDLLVKGFIAAKKNPGLAFSTDALTYEIGSSKAFVEPTLANPNNLAVHYETQDWQIVNVDYFTGKITFSGEVGTAKIIAKSEETTEFDAAEVSYTITVTDPMSVYKNKLNTPDNGFTEESGLGLWKYDGNWGCMTAKYNANVEEKKAEYLVSPEIKLNADGNVVSFEQYYQNVEKPAEVGKLAIREVGGQWMDLAIKNYPEVGAWDFKSTDEIAIPAEFNGKNVQIAFIFVNTKDAELKVRNLYVAKAVERAEAGISYDKAEITYYVGSDAGFIAPKLNNPNDLSVKYSAIDNNGIIELNENTGDVKILKAGTVKVVAKTERSNSFNAGEASYTLTVIDNTIVFEAPFAGEMSGFKEEGNGNYWSADGYSNTSLWLNTDNFPATGTKVYLVSPKFTLGKSGNTVQWEQNGANLDYENCVKFAIRNVGGTWEEFAVKNEGEAAFGYYKTEKIAIPEAYNNKEVEIALIFVAPDCTGLDYLGWNLKNLVVRKAYEPAKAEAGLAFDKETAEYDMGADLLFEAPVLVNPNNLTVKYSSSNAEVATVDELTGVVTFVGKGVTTIKATSEETAEFLAGEASYTLTVIMTPTGIEAIVGEDLQNAKIYDLQGRRVNKLGKGIFIINGKKVVIK